MSGLLHCHNKFGMFIKSFIASAPGLYKGTTENRLAPNGLTPMKLRSSKFTTTLSTNERRHKQKINRLIAKKARSRPIFFFSDNFSHVLNSIKSEEISREITSFSTNNG